MAVLTVDQILDGPALGLTSGMADLLVVDFGGRRVLYALSRAENLLLEIEIAGDGSLSVVGSIAIMGTFQAGSAPVLGVLVDGSALTLSGLTASDGQSVTLSGTGILGNQTTLAGLGTLAAPVGIDLGGTETLIYASGSGLTMATDTGGGYTPVATLADTSVNYLANVVASVSFNEGGSVRFAAISALEDGLTIASVTPTALVQTGSFGPAEGLPIDTPQGIAVIQRGAETLLAVASSGTSSVSIVRVSGGVPVLADHVLDSGSTRFGGASEVVGATYGDFAFLAAAGAEGGVSLFTVLPGGRMVHLSSIADDETLPLDRVSSLEATVLGSVLHVMAVSAEAGLSRLGYDLSGLGTVVEADGTGAGVAGTSADDQIVGSDVGEALSGGAGDDIVFDGAGSDTLSGGTGADLFVFAQDGQADTVTDFQRGVDKLDLSAFDFLYDVSQLTITSTATGAILSHRGETITVFTSDGAPLTAADLATADILNLDRPPFLPIGLQLEGGLGPDVLNGGFGPDTILGYAGDDTLSGYFGDDLIWGQGGFDRLEGGAGNDTLLGHADDDTIIGGAGDDLIEGGAGGDVLYGDDWTGG